MRRQLPHDRTSGSPSVSQIDVVTIRSISVKFGRTMISYCITQVSIAHCMCRAQDVLARAAGAGNSPRLARRKVAAGVRLNFTVKVS